MFGLKWIHPAITPPNSLPLLLPSKQPAFLQVNVEMSLSTVKSLSSCQTQMVILLLVFPDYVVHTSYYYGYLTYTRLLIY